MELDKDPFENLMPGGGQAVGTNPFMGVFKTSDGKFINLTVLSPGPYIEDVFGHRGIPEGAQDERFSTAEALMATAADATPRVKAAIAAKIGRTHVRTPGTTAHLVCHLQIEQITHMNQ